MDNRFFDRPILNSPYEYPRRHWELDDQGQPTQHVIEKRRRAEFNKMIEGIVKDWEKAQHEASGS